MPLDLAPHPNVGHRPVIKTMTTMSRRAILATLALATDMAFKTTGRVPVDVSRGEKAPHHRVGLSSTIRPSPINTVSHRSRRWARRRTALINRA